MSFSTEHTSTPWVEQINETKFSPPYTRGRQVQRKSFIRELNKYSQLPLILVRAPAGYGKSNSVVQWLEEMRRAGKCVAWLSIDTLDNNIKRLLAHFVSCLGQSHKKFGASIQGQLNSPGKLSMSALAATISLEISRLDDPVHIVLDDFHLINNSEIIKLFELLLQNPPANLSLIIISRMTLPIATSRMKASGQFHEFSANDLRFNHSEVGQFFLLENAIELREETISSLTKKTEGWIAGLKLTSLSLKGQEDVDEFVTSFSGSNYDIAGFLAEEVFNKQTVKTQQFLLKTSVLERMCSDLCNHLTKRDDSQQLLEELQQSGLFIIALDKENKWYRYHHLFADFLLKRLRASQPGADKSLYAGASEWFAEHSFIDEGIKNALMADDKDTAISLLDSASNQMFYGGRLSAIGHWVEVIGDSHLERHPLLLLNYAWVLIVEWRFLYVNKLLRRVEKTLAEFKAAGESDAEIKELELIIGHRDMMLYQFADEMAKMRQISEQLLADYDIKDPYLAGNLYSALLYAGREFLDISNYENYSAKARELYKAAGSTFVLVWHGSLEGPTAYMAGNVDDANEILSDAWKYAVKISGEISPLAAIPALLLTEVLYEQNEIDRVDSLLDRYLPLSEQIGFIDQIIAGIVTKSKVLCQKGLLAKAKSVLQRGEQFAKAHNFDRLKVALLAELVRIACIEGDKKAAKKHITNLDLIIARESLKPKQNVRTTHAMAALAWCRYLRLNGEYSESISLAKAWARFCLQRGIYREYMQFAATQITTHQIQGEQRAAMRLLHQTLEGIKGRKLINSLFGDGPVIERMLVSMLSTGSETKTELAEQVREILKTVNISTQSLVGGRVDTEEPIEALDKQELTILKMVDEGHSNKEIANQLNVTEGTVKWYMQNIYNKLGVRRRTKAAKLAKDLGLLGH